MPRQQELTPVQKAQRQISAMGDSVDLINRLISQGQHTENVHETIDRNVRHLEIMLGKDHIQNAGADLTSFETAVTDGNAFTAQPIT